MILNNVTMIVNGELVKRDIYFEKEIYYIKKELSRGVDCTGLLLIPGLRNAHVHLGSRLVAGSALGMTKYEYLDSIGFGIHKKRTKEDIYKASLLACIESIRNGVTHIDTMDVDPEPVIKAIKKTGMSYTASLAIKDNHTEAGDVDAQFNKTLKLGLIVGLANEFESTPELIKKGLFFAKEHDLPIHMHACETKEEVIHFRKLTGKRTIEYLSEIGMLDHDVRIAHCTYANSMDIMQLANHDVTVLHCPTSNKAISDNTPPIKDMVRNKIRIQLGTDSFAWNPNASILKEAWMSHEHTGISIEDAYKMTHDELNEGNEASFSLWSLDELKPYSNTSELIAKIMNTNTIKKVYIKGKKIIDNGKLIMKLSEEKLIKDVEKAKKRVLK